MCRPFQTCKHEHRISKFEEQRLVTIHIAEGIEAIEKLAPEWESLIPRNSAAIFSGPPWYLAWAEAFQVKSVTVISAYEGGRLVALLPMGRVRGDARGLYFSEVTPFPLGDYQPFLADPAVAAEAVPRLFDAALKYYGLTSAYWWPHIPDDDPSLPILRSYLANRSMQHVEDVEPAPRLRIAGADYATVERGWPANHRTDVRRQRKRLAEKHGPVTLWQPATVEEGLATLDEFFDVHDAKWLAQGIPGKFQDAAERRYFRSLVRRLWGAGIHISTVRCGEQHISYHIGFISGGWLLWYRPSYRPEFGNLSPSKIHVSMLIEQACEQRLEGVDFLLGEEPYKYWWSNDERKVVNIHAGFRTSPAYWWFSHGKPLVRRRLYKPYWRLKAWWQKKRSSV